MYKIAYTLLFTLFVNFSVSCDNDIKNKANSDPIFKWLGSNSKFSESYKIGKCSLDEVLDGLPASEKRVIANLIAKSYKILDNDKKDLLSSYSY